MKKVKKTEKTKELEDYLIIKKYVEKAINSVTLCRVLFLLIDGVNYNDALAKAYYETSRERKIPNPKVTSIYLADLRKANFIKRAEKDGRKQIYEVNWEGILDVLKFRNLMNPNKKDYSMTFFLGLSGYFDGRYTKNGIKLISNDLSEKFLKPYMEYAVEIEKETGGAIEFDTSSGKYTKLVTIKSKNFDHIDFNLLSLLERFDKTLFDIIPLMYPNKIKKASECKNLKNLPSLYALISYFLENQKILHMIYEDAGNPEIAILDSFNRGLENLKERER